MFALVKKIRRRASAVHFVLLVFFLPVAFSLYRIFRHGNAIEEFSLWHSTLLFLVLLVVFYIARDIAHDVVIVDPISVPWDFESAGLTPAVMAQRVGDRLRQIESATTTSMRKDSLTAIQDETATPDVEIPGTKMGLKTMSAMIRNLLGIYRKHVGGDVVYSAAEPGDAPTSGPNAESGLVTVTVYVTKGRERTASTCRAVPASDIDALVQCAAEMALGQINPYVLARHRVDSGAYDEAISLVTTILEEREDSSENEQYKVAALSLWGNALFAQGNFEGAIEKYRQAIVLDGKDGYSHTRWAAALAALKQPAEAEEKYRIAMELDPKDLEARRGLEGLQNRG
jgi:hypothetical protein